MLGRVVHSQNTAKKGTTIDRPDSDEATGRFRPATAIETHFDVNGVWWNTVQPSTSIAGDGHLRLSRVLILSCV